MTPTRRTRKGDDLKTGNRLEKALQPPGMCSWCGHPPHGETCPERGVRVGGTAKKPITTDCQCQRGSYAGGR